MVNQYTNLHCGSFCVALSPCASMPAESRMKHQPIHEEFIMDTSHAKLQPQDPTAAKLGTLVFRIGLVAVAVMAAASFLRS